MNECVLYGNRKYCMRLSMDTGCKRYRTSVCCACKWSKSWHWMSTIATGQDRSTAMQLVCLQAKQASKHTRFAGRPEDWAG